MTVLDLWQFGAAEVGCCRDCRHRPHNVYLQLSTLTHLVYSVLAALCYA